jgi:hypothetical protein
MAVMRNPGDGSEGEVPDETVPFWEGKGWTVVEADAEDNLTPKQRLVQRASLAGLDTSGTKADLEERLRAAGQEV